LASTFQNIVAESQIAGVDPRSRLSFVHQLSGKQMARAGFFVGLTALCFLGVATAATAAETRYTYDALGRLTKVEAGNGRVTEYTYDAANNRTKVTSTGGSSGRVVVLPLLGGLVLPLP